MLEPSQIIIGMEVRFIGEHGLPFSIEQAERVLKKGKTYLEEEKPEDGNETLSTTQRLKSWACKPYVDQTKA